MAKNKGKLICFFLLLLVLAYFLIKKEKIVVTEDAMANMQDFDIILVEGQSVHSKFVKLFNRSNTDYSHIGILVHDEGKVYVLHATPDGNENNGIRYDELQSFFDLSAVCSYTILRHPQLTDDFREKLRVEFFKAKAQIAPFDYAFNNYENGKLYCTELVWLVFKNVGLIEEGVFNLERPIYPGEFLKLRLLTVNSQRTTVNS